MVDREQIQDLAKRDLYFFAREVLKYDKMIERVHRPVAEHYVRKQPGVPLVLQDVVKNRILLDPRGHYKTSMNIADKIQWMLVCPEVSILLFSGSKERTTDMVTEIKAHFLENRTFRELFPAFVPAEGINTMDKMTSFTIPARKRFRRAPTLSIATLGSVKASIHVDIRDGDDVVNEINSRTQEGCAQTITDWGHTTPLVNPGGYTHLTGTTYDFSDLYSQQAEKGSLAWKIFRRGAWTYDENGKRHLLFPEQFCTNDDPDPSKANLDEIRDEIGPTIFAAQYMNDPVASACPKFPIPLLEQQTISRRQMPADMNMFLLLDLASTANELSDYTAGVFGGYGSDGSQFIFDGWRGQLNASQIVMAIISGAKKWSIQRVGIEDAVGTRFLAPGLYAKMKELGSNIVIDWIPVKRTKGRKQAQVEGLEALLVQKKLWFAKEMAILPQIYTEFSRYPKYRHDDLPDAIALLEYYRNMVPYNKFVDLETGPVDLGGVSENSMFNDLDYGPSPEGDLECLSGGLVG